MPTILVTGGAGFIGSSLVDRLMESENDVIVFDNLSTGSRHNISRWIGSQNFRFTLGDILDQTCLTKAVKSCELVFHLAANPEVRVGDMDTKIDYEQNLLATYNLLEAMRLSSKCKKIVFTSSSVIYGEPDSIPTSEKHSPLIPISLYGATKLACEALISGYCNMFKMYGVAARLANVVGPKSTHGVIFDFVTKLSRNPKCLDILGDGRQTKSYLYIDDCIDALMHIAKTERVFETYNVGSDDKLNVLEIAEIVINNLSLDGVNLTINGGIDGRGWNGDVKEMLLDSSKLKAYGWKARYNSRGAVDLAVRGIINALENVYVKEH